MPKIEDIESGRVFDVASDAASRMIKSGRYRLSSGETIVSTDASGYASESSAEDYARLESRGGVAEDIAGERARIDEARMEEEHGGVVGTATTLVESAAGSASFGLTDYIAGAIGGEDYREDRRERRTVNSTAALVGDIGGMVLPALATGGTSAAAKLLAKTPAGLAASLGTKRTIKGFIAEGVVSGAGQGAHELAVSEDPYNLEQAASTIGSSALMGGLVGGGVGIFGKAASKGLSKARNVLSEAGESAGKGAQVSDDLASLDLAGLRDAKRAQQFKHGESLADDAAGYHKLSQEIDPMLIAEGGHKSVLRSVKSARRRLLDNPKALAKRPSGMLGHLQKEEKVLAEILENQDTLIAKLAREDVILSKKLAKLGAGKIKDKAARKYSEWAGKNLTRDAAKEGIEVAPDELAKFRAALDSGELGGARSRTMGRVDELLESNRASQTKIEALLDGTTDEIRAIDAATDALKAPKAEKTMAEQAASGMLFGAATSLAAPLGPLAPLIGAKVSKKLMDLTLGRIGKSAAEASVRTAKAIDTLLEVGAKSGKVAVPVATNTLRMASYASPKKGKDAPDEDASLAKLFRERSTELLSQVERGPEGVRMHRRARTELAAKLAPVRAISPYLADAIETTQARKIAYLADKLPKRPDYLQHTSGPDSWSPPDFEIRSFARHMAAIEDPGGVEERLADGTLSPEDAEAYRTVYPEKYAALQRDITQRLGELREQLSYQKRLSLSIFTGVAVEPAMDTRIFAQLQAQHQSEPGTAGGTEAPTPQAQFGSVKSQEAATPSQERQQS